jgi:hypothetical protein
MKRQGLLILILGVVLLPSLAYAQGMYGTVAAANIPFAFTVNNTTLPAGSYTISNRGRGSDLLWIGSDDAKAGTFVTPLHSGKKAARTVLVFHRYGDRYFLKSIDRKGYASGYEFAAGRLEKELRTQIIKDTEQAQNRTAPEEILVAAN